MKDAEEKLEHHEISFIENHEISLSLDLKKGKGKRLSMDILAFPFETPTYLPFPKAAVLSVVKYNGITSYPKYRLTVECPECHRIHSFIINNLKCQYPARFKEIILKALPITCSCGYYIRVRFIDTFVFRTNYDNIDMVYLFKRNCLMLFYPANGSRRCLNLNFEDNKHYIDSVKHFPKIAEHLSEWQKTFKDLAHCLSHIARKRYRRSMPIKLSLKLMLDKVVLNWKPIGECSLYTVFVKHNDTVYTYTTTNTSYTVYTSEPNSTYGFAVAPEGFITNKNDVHNEDYVEIKTPERKGTKKTIPSDTEHDEHSYNEEIYEFMPADVIVLSTTLQCVGKGHSAENVRAYLPVMTASGQENISVEVGYCKQCRRYIMLLSIYEKVRETGIPICTIIDEGNRIIHKEGDNPFVCFNTESILHINGYNVDARNNLSAEDRKKILVRIIDNGIASQNDVISHLENLIRINKKNYNMNVAVEKWLEDVEFVKNYKPINSRNVIVNSIKSPPTNH